MQKLIRILLISCLVLLSVFGPGAFAETASQKKQPATQRVGLSDTKVNTIKAKVKAAYPQITIDSVEASPLKGWLEATAGNTVLYVSEDAHHMFAGELLDLTLPEDERDLTENVRRGLRLKLFHNLNKKDMIVYPVKEGQPKRATVIAFVDSDCSYCHKLHEEIEKLASAGIEMNYMAFPRAGIGSSTYAHMVSAWCAENRSQAFDLLMKGEGIPEKECSNPIADQFLLGQKLGITGTPTLFLEDGSTIPGYMPADKLTHEAVKHLKPKSKEHK